LAVSLALFWSPLAELLRIARLPTGNHEYDQYSHTPLIPLIVAVLLWRERKRILANVKQDYVIGAALLAAGGALHWWVAGIAQQWVPDAGLSTSILGAVLFWIGSFILVYGLAAFRAGAFALLFLFLTVPIPSILLDGPVRIVQAGSTEVCAFVFDLLRVPVLRNGFVFSLPNVSIEVVKECSGIHSTLAFFILSLLVGHFLFTSWWKKVFLVALTLPLVCITNGLRIALLTLLAVYVDPSFLTGNLHRRGGAAFFLLGLLLMWPIVRFLERGDAAKALRDQESGQPAGAGIY